MQPHQPSHPPPLPRRPSLTRPNPDTLAGAWRNGKGKRPLGAYAGPDQPLITNPGTARRAIYIPAFKRLITNWLEDPDVQKVLAYARNWQGPVFSAITAEASTGDGPMSHAWLLCTWLNALAPGLALADLIAAI